VKLKTPFTFAGYSFTGRGSLFDADNEMVIIGIDSEQGQEIARRVNAYDALIEACGAMVAKMYAVTDSLPELDARAMWLDDNFAGEVIGLRSALALVRQPKEGEDGMHQDAG